MYYYVYDEYTSEKRFQKQIAALETRITELELLGKVARLALFREPEALLERELTKSVTTVVVVGNDKTIFRVLNQVVKHRLVLGLLPIGGDHQVCAQALGIPQTVDACDVLSARTTVAIDTLLLNGKRCMTSVHVPFFEGQIAFETYAVVSQRAGVLEIQNLTATEDVDPKKRVNPTDGVCEVLFKPSKEGFFLWSGRKEQTQTRLPISHCTLFSKDGIIRGTADGFPIEFPTLHVEVDPGSVRVISGKDRLFQVVPLAKT